MSSALQKADNPARMGRALIVADALQQESDQRKLLGEYIRHQMVEGHDYGVIPGTTAKTLLKPGAEKLAQLYRCIPLFDEQDKVEDWASGLFHYRFLCRIVSQEDGAVVAQGVGSCSTYESRYRWRTQDRKCPMCGKESIKRSKFPPKDAPSEPPGWYCFGKVGGCGANFDHDDDEIIGQPTGRVQNPDILDAVNTVLKMAKKRALVDAAVGLARCSDIFTQDMEDFDPTPVPVVSVRQAGPQVDPHAAARKRLEDATTLSELASVWNSLSPDAQRALTVVKEERKISLAGAERANAAKPAEVATKPVAVATPAVKEGEQRPDFTSAPTATPTRATAAANNSAPTTTSRSEPMPVQTPGTRASEILALAHQIGVSWSDLRDGIGAGGEIADSVGLPRPMDFGAKITDLDESAMKRLKLELDVRLLERQQERGRRADVAARKAKADSGQLQGAEVSHG